MATNLIAAQVVVLYCTKHTTEEMDMYCKQCQTATCTKCMGVDHLGHELDTVAKLSRKLTNNRTEFLMDLTAKFDMKRKPRMRLLREVKCRNEHLFTDNVNSLEETREKLHHIVDELVDKEVNTCQTNKAQHDADLDKMERPHIEDDEKIQKMLTTFEKTTMTGIDIIEYHEKLSALIEGKEVVSGAEKFCNRLVYRQGKIERNELQRMVGEMRKAKEVLESPEQISMFRYQESNVYTIRPVSSYNAWFKFNNNPEHFALFNKEGQQKTTFQSQKGNLSFLVTVDNNFISADYESKGVMRIDLSGKTTNILKSSDLRPVEIGSALNGNILVSFVDTMSSSRTAESQRKVQMLTPQGEVLHTYEFEKDGSTPVFTYPIRPTQNYNSNVCVVNKYSVSVRPKSYRGNVCVFYEDGGLKFIYRGHGQEISPLGICCDSLCNIIFGSYLLNTNSVHIIDSEGKFLKFLFTNETCVPSPSSMALYKDVLWVGSASGEVRVYRYKY